MKKSKSFFLVFMLLACHTICSQELSFGFTLGPNYTSLLETYPNESNKISKTSTPKELSFYMAAYGNYQLNKRLGLVTNISLDSRCPNYSFSDEYSVNLTYVGINPMLKIDVGGEYNRGFYFKPGFRYSILLSAKDKELDVKITDSFEKPNLGITFSFGSDFSKFIGLEFVADYQLNELQKDSNQKTLAVYMLATINLQKILSKK